MSCVEASGTRRYTASTRLSHVDRAVGRPNASRRSGVGKRPDKAQACPVRSRLPSCVLSSTAVVESGE